MDSQEMDKMRKCCVLLPPPGEEVVIKCLDEIDHLQSEVERLRGILHECKARIEEVKKLQEQVKTLTAVLDAAEHITCRRDARIKLLNRNMGWFVARLDTLKEAVANANDTLGRYE